MLCMLYRTEDQGSLEAFLYRMYEARGMVFDPEGLHYDLSHVDLSYMDKGGFWLLKDRDNNVAGSIGLRLLEEANRIGEIKRYFILPEFQGRGYGKLLMQTALDYGRREGFRLLRLDTMKQAVKAQSIFKQFGFTEIPRYNDNPMADYFYELALETEAAV